MDLSTLARRQKRAVDWLTALESEPSHSTIRSEFVALLERYQALLWQIAESKGATADQLNALDTLERGLTECNELVRFAAAQRHRGAN